MFEWPEIIQRKLEKFKDPRDTERFPDLQEGVKDVTSKCEDLIQAFTPSIEIPRRTLFRKSGMTLFARALQEPDDEVREEPESEDSKKPKQSRICLQYFYTFPFRIGILSHTFNLFGPILMITWAAVVYQLFVTGFFPLLYIQLPSIMTAITLAPILFLGLEPHIKDMFRHPKGSRLNVRPATWLVLYYLLALGLTSFWSTWNTLFSSSLFIGIVLVFIIYFASVFRTRRFQSKYLMEYMTVIKWLKKTSEGWVLETVSWPYYNKRTNYLNRLLLETSPFRIRDRRISKVKPIGPKGQVRFHIDNTWASLQLDHREKLRLYQILNLLLLLIVVPLSFLTLPLILTIFTCVGLILVLFVVVAVEWPTKLNLEVQMPEKGEDRLKELWSLLRKARLTFIWKLQHPFQKSVYYTTIEDSIVRVVIDLFDKEEKKKKKKDKKDEEEEEVEEDARVIVCGNATPEDAAGLTTEEFQSDGVNPVIFEKRYILSQKQLASLLNMENLKDKIVEGDVFESSEVRTLLQHVQTHFKEPPQLTEIHPKLDIPFTKVTDRIQKKHRDRQYLVRKSTVELKLPDYYKTPKQLKSNYPPLHDDMKAVYPRSPKEEGAN